MTTSDHDKPSLLKVLSDLGLVSRAESDRLKKAWKETEDEFLARYLVENGSLSEIQISMAVKLRKSLCSSDHRISSRAHLQLVKSRMEIVDTHRRTLKVVGDRVILKGKQAKQAVTSEFQAVGPKVLKGKV